MSTKNLVNVGMVSRALTRIQLLYRLNFLNRVRFVYWRISNCNPDIAV